MILHNVSHKRSLSQSMSAAYLPFLWQSICRVVRELKSCYRVILSSQLSGMYCLKKKNWETFIFFIWSISQNFVHSTWLILCFKRGNFFKIVLRVKTSSAVLQPRFSRVTIKSDVPLTYRVRGPYCKIWTEFFSAWIYGSSTKHRGKTRFHDLQWEQRKVRYLWYLLIQIEGKKISIQAERPLKIAQQILSTRTFYWLPIETGLWGVKSSKCSFNTHC